jgi:hypothetical protein
LQSIEKTSEYRKKCFDTIILIVEENKALKEDIARLQVALQLVQREQGTLQTSVDEQRHLRVYDQIFTHYSDYNWLTNHVLLGRHGGREDIPC